MSLAQLSMAQLSGAKLSRAQLSAPKKWQIGPRTVGPRGPTVWGPIVRGPTVRGPICLKPFFYWCRPESVEDGKIPTKRVHLLNLGRLAELRHSCSPLEGFGAGALVLGAREAQRCMSWSRWWLRPDLRWQTCSLNIEVSQCPGKLNWQVLLGMCAAASLSVLYSSRQDSS